MSRSVREPPASRSLVLYAAVGRKVSAEERFDVPVITTLVAVAAKRRCPLDLAWYEAIRRSDTACGGCPAGRIGDSAEAVRVSRGASPGAASENRAEVARRPEAS
jgi:hypothetical protein